MKFPEYSSLNLPKINEDILKTWKDEDLFAKSLKVREGAPSFVFFEGPPSANGMPGIHHVMARTIKDIFCRFKTMKGFYVNRKAGWDTHGLPVELGVEKSLGITKEDIGHKISVDDYNATCRSEVMKYTREWETLTNNMGYWVNMDDPYITYDNRYIESVWWLLAQLYSKDYLYKGYTIQPYSPAAGTGLSSHELNQPGCYRDVKDTTCIAQFDITDPGEKMLGWGKPVFLAWTTTPWTLPSNMALCVGPSIDYVAVRSYNRYNGEKITAIVAKALVDSVFNPKAKDIALEDFKPGDKLVPYEVVAEFKGSDLVGMHYRQLIPWMKPDGWENAFRVIPGDYVTVEDGTGIVHIAGTFGADDKRVSALNGIPAMELVNKAGKIVPMVDLKGRFYLLDDLSETFVKNNVDVEAYTPWQGKFVKNAYDPAKSENDITLDIEICMMLKEQGNLFQSEKHVHSYPHCWRTDKPVLYYPLDSWFIRSTAARERLMKLNESIKWKPASTGSGRFGKWLENLQDWNLSRSRYWGTPLPIWRTEDESEELIIDSVQMLWDEIEKAVAAGVMASNPLKDKGFIPGDYSKDNYAKIDLHRPYVDDIILVSPSGKPMKRELDLIDVWFDSGAMPYAQIHYPFENKDAFENGKAYPADFIAEGVDQTRGWFFTLHAIAGMIFDRIAYKAVVSNGLVLDKDGNKMSKRLGNAVNPFEAISQYGSDPLRWYMIANSSPWDDLKYDPAGVTEVGRKFFATIYNTYGFFAQYANVDGFTGEEPQVDVAKRPEIDRWILSRLNTLVEVCNESLEDYEPTKAARAINDFVLYDLSNWYVRLNRKRFWRAGMGENKLAAFQTLYTCLLTVARLIAPVAPFYSDRLYRDLTEGKSGYPSSVHLDKYPEAQRNLIDTELNSRMEMAQKLTSMVLSLRRKVNIKVRQPLAEIIVPVADDNMRARISSISELLLSEINVKNLKLVNDGDGVLVKRVKPDFKKLGPKFGKQMKAAAKAISELSQDEISLLEKEGSLQLTLDGVTAVVERADVDIFSEDIPGWLVANDGALTVALDVTVSEELRREGFARDIINRVQNIRKDRGYEITDRIVLTFAPDEVLDGVLKQFGEYIASQVLAESVSTDPAVADASNAEALDIDGYIVKVIINKC